MYIAITRSQGCTRTFFSALTGFTSWLMYAYCELQIQAWHLNNASFVYMYSIRYKLQLLEVFVLVEKLHGNTARNILMYINSSRAWDWGIYCYEVNLYICLLINDNEDW